MRNGVLFVTVATHAWLQELRFLKEQLRARINARLGAELVRDIVFITGAIEEPPPAEAPPAAAASCPAPIELPPIADPELCAAFDRLLQARSRWMSRRVTRDT